MPNLKKLLFRFDEEERKLILATIKAIISLNWRSLDIKKLKGHDNIFRVRKGKIRIIFAKNKKEIFILAIERRRENTYKI